MGKRKRERESFTGILSAIAAVISAAASLILALKQ